MIFERDKLFVENPLYRFLKIILKKMMKKLINICLIITTMLSSNLNSQVKKAYNKLNEMYELATEKPNLNIEYEFIQHGEIRKENASMGDLLSRMWGHFGKPQKILFEGYLYEIKDKKTGLSFTVSYGASGPAYYTEKVNVEKLRLAVIQFEKLLNDSENADCEIEIETDFGIYLCGSKNGIPYDIPKDEEQSNQSNIRSSGDQDFDNLVTKLRDSMVNTVKEYNDLSIQNEIDNYVIYLSAFGKAIFNSKSKDETDYPIMVMVKMFNNSIKNERKVYLRKRERDQIVKILNFANQKMGYSASEEDVTKKWREW